MGIRGLEPGLFVDLEGCGSQRDFYAGVITEIKDAIPYVNEEFTGTKRMKYPYRFNFSVGSLPSDPTDYYAAVVRPGRTPYESNITLNRDNPNHLGLDKTAFILNHEIAHGIGDAHGYDTSENTTEKINYRSLNKAGKEKIAELGYKSSMYKEKKRELKDKGPMYI